jgi:NH3-dependent NAD+ synthetase
MAIAERLNVPASSPAGFESSPTDAERLGVDHATLDAVLVGLVEDGESPATVAERVGVDSATAERVADWVAVTAHKRQPPKVSDDAHEAR